jgi:hypothetical protein
VDRLRGCEDANGVPGHVDGGLTMSDSYWGGSTKKKRKKKDDCDHDKWGSWGHWGDDKCDSWGKCDSDSDDKWGHWGKCG